MVLRIILITILISSFSIARTTNNQKSLYLKKAQKLYVKGNINGAMKTLNKFYNLKKPLELPSSVLNLLGLIYQKKKKFSLSSKLFHLVIRKKYSSKHKDVIREKNFGGVSDMDIPKKLLRIYYHLGQNYYYIYSKTDNFSYFNASKIYFELCEDKNHLSSNTKRYLDSLNSKLEYVRSFEKTLKFYVNAGGILFQEPIKLINKTDDNDTKTLISNNQGVCAGLGMTYGNIKHGWDLYGCAFTAAATITNKAGDSVEYKQKDVPVNGIYLSPGYYYRPLDEYSSIGISFPLFYRSGEYSDTDNYKVGSLGQLSAGLALDAKWGITESISFDLKFSNMGATNLFLNSISYHF